MLKYRRSFVWIVQKHFRVIVAWKWRVIIIRNARYSPEGGIGCCVTLRIGPALGNLACWPMPIPACIIWAWAALYSGGGGLTPPIPPAICCCCCITWNTKQTMDFNYIKSRVSGHCNFESKPTALLCYQLRTDSSQVWSYFSKQKWNGIVCCKSQKIWNWKFSQILAQFDMENNSKRRLKNKINKKK